MILSNKKDLRGRNRQKTRIFEARRRNFLICAAQELQGKALKIEWRGRIRWWRWSLSFIVISKCNDLNDQRCECIVFGMWLLILALFEMERLE
jgi:hypothetical protein